MFILFLIILWSGRDIEKNRPRHGRILRAFFPSLKKIFYPVKDLSPHISNCNKKLKQQIKDIFARIFVN